MALDLKRRERRRERLREVPAVEPAIPDAQVFGTLDLDRLETCLSRLGARERMMILLTFYAERSARQVGKEMDLPEGNARVIRHRAIGKLARA